MTQNAINNRASEMSIGDVFITADTISTQSANANLIIAPNGTGVTEVANGITFDTVHVLKNYVTQTNWTPVLTFGGASVGITYTTQQGVYLRIGDLVFVEMEILLSSKGSSTGDAIITGLPLPVAANSFLNIRWADVTFDATYTTAVGAASLSQIILQQVGNNNAFIALDDTNFSNATNIFFSGVYPTS